MKKAPHKSKKLKVVILLIICSVIIFGFFRKELIYQPYRSYKASQAIADTLLISIKTNDYKFTDSLRLDAMNSGIITPAHKQYVKGTVTYGKENAQIKIRLKGDQIDHYKTDPPSFRIKVQKGKTILGMNKFSIHSFDIRNFKLEWIFHKLLEQQDILSLKMDFIEMNLNGKTTLSTYEEHFTHFLTDRFKRPRGPIICISEDYLWNGGKVNDTLTYRTEKEMYLHSPIKEFKYYADLQSEDVFQAKKLLNEYRNGSKKADEVFNIDQLAMYFAISDLCNTHHALRWHNNRFYYNPTTKKLELIGFDGSSWEPLSKFAIQDDFLPVITWTGLDKDELFKRKYFEKLKIVSEKAFLNDFFGQNKLEIENFINNIQKRNLQLDKELYKDDLFTIDKFEILFNNAKWIRLHLESLK